MSYLAPTNQRMSEPFHVAADAVQRCTSLALQFAFLPNGRRTYTVIAHFGDEVSQASGINLKPPTVATTVRRNSAVVDIFAISLKPTLYVRTTATQNTKSAL